MLIERWNYEQDGLLDEFTMRRKLEAKGYAVSRYLYPPGTYFPLHTHHEDKIDAVVSGRFRVTMGEEEVLLGAGDALHVPCGVEHSAEVVGDDEVISLDAVKLQP
jgi:quercetin dioxygenase-like cupin family protein